MQEQIWGQLVQVLQDKAGLDAEKAQQVAQVVSDFAQEHAGDLVKMASEGGSGGVMGQVGKLFGR